MTEPLRIGVLGAARITELALVQPARRTGDRLVAVAARDPARAAAAADELGVERVLRGYAELIADPEVEVVYNPLANGLHGPWNLAAIAAGKHVLSEKPFASNAAEARAVRDAAVGAGVTVLEGFHYVHHPVMRRLHELVSAGELGELRRVETLFAMPAPPDDDPRWSFGLAGGALMDLGCYCAARAADAGAVGRRRAAGDRVPRGPPSGPAVPASTSGWTSSWSSPVAPPGWRTATWPRPDWDISCRVVGSRGEATASNFVRPDQDDRVLVSTPTGDREEHLGTRSSYTYQLEALRAHLRDGVPLPIDVHDAVATAELIDEAYRAAGYPPRPTTPLAAAAPPPSP